MRAVASCIWRWQSRQQSEGEEERGEGKREREEKRKEEGRGMEEEIKALIKVLITACTCSLKGKPTVYTLCGVTQSNTQNTSFGQYRPTYYT